MLLLACRPSITSIFKITNTTAGTVNHLSAKSKCNKLQQILRARALSSRLQNCFKMFGCVWFQGRELMSCLHKSQEMGTTYYSYPRLFELKTEAHWKKANMATAQWDITQCQWLAVFFPSNFSFFPPGSVSPLLFPSVAPSECRTFLFVCSCWALPADPPLDFPKADINITGHCDGVIFMEAPEEVTWPWLVPRGPGVSIKPVVLAHISINEVEKLRK